MTNLLIPRYKVIADYPQGYFLDNKEKNPVQIGDIFMQLVNNSTVWRQLNKHRNDFTNITIHNPEWFPAIFKKLEWWEERKIEEMPKYVKRHDGIEKVFNWRKEWGEWKCDFWTTYEHDGVKRKMKIANVSIKYDQPATEEEYLNYKKSIK